MSNIEHLLFNSNDFKTIQPHNPNVTVLEYIWIGGEGQDLRGKTKVLQEKVTKLEDFPIWNFDGSSTKQATTESSEVLLKPVAKYPDPFRAKTFPNSFLVLCEAITTDGKTPATANFRHICNKIMEKAKDQKPWFGFEQEYILLKSEGVDMFWPLGFPKGGYASPQGQYYCSVGAKNSFGRTIPEAHLAACLYAGVTIAGLNGEVFPGQWEFQVGPVEGVHAPDQLWMARYILRRVAEDFGVEVTFEPKPVKGDWNGTGCHSNYSTLDTRNEGGFDVIIGMMDKLAAKHSEHILIYGKDNNLRLTGAHETSSMKKFSYNVANRGASVRIPTVTRDEKKGYFEDRRPAGNCDPYLVAGMLVDTTVNDGVLGAELVKAFGGFGMSYLRRGDSLF